MIEYAVPLFGRIVVIKKSGCDGSIFPLWNKECLIGRHEDCDIRIQLADVSAQHARVSVAEDSKVYIESLGRNGVGVNGTRVIEGAVLLKHKDVFEISDRSFRFEYPADHSSGSPGAGASEPRKRVSFGPMISPEYIDKSLPPSTPIKKGALPDVVPGTPVSHMKRRFRRKVAATPQHDSILETNEEPVGVLVRHDNDTPLVKESSGFRTSPRTSNEEKKSDVENFITSPAPSPQKKPKYSKDTVATRKKTPEKTPRKKSLTLSKKPSNFYGASAAKTPRGAKKPLPKTPKKIALKTPKKTTLKTPKKATLKTPKKRTPKTPKKATPKKTTSKTPKKVIAKTPRKISSKVIKTTEKLTKSGKKSSATSWADVLKKNVGKTPKATKVARESRLALEKARMQIGKKKRTKKSYLTKKTSIKASKYRHAESPEDIVIHRRGSHSNLRIISSPSKSLKKGRKSLKLVSQSSTSRVEEDIVSSPSRSFTKSKSPSSVVKKLRNEKSSDSPRKSSKKLNFTRVRSKSVSSMSQKLTSKRRARSQSNSKSSTSFEIDRLQNYVAQRIKSPCKTVKKFLLYQSPTSMKVDSVSTPSSSKRGRPRTRPLTSPRGSSSVESDRNSTTPKKSYAINTPSSSKRGRPIKTPSTTPRSSSVSNVSRNSISPTKSQNSKTPSSSKRRRSSKTPSATPRSLSTSNVSRNTISPTKSQDSKTPSSSKRRRTSKTPSATPRSLSASNVSRNTISPTKSQNIKTPSSSKRGRTSKTPSARPRSLSASNVSRNTNSPTKSQDSKTPSSSKRGRTSKTPSATPRNSSASNITKKFGIPTKSQKIKTPSSLQGRPRKSHSTGRRSSFVPNTTKFKRSKSCSNMNSLEFKKQKNIRLSSSKVNISRSKYYLQNSTPLVSEKSLMSNRVLHSPSVFINASLEGISIPSSSKTPANSPSSGVASMNFSQRLNKSLRESLGGLQNSSFFDFDSVKTPKIPIQVLVSPLLAESIHIDGRILKPSRSKPGKRVSLNNIDVQRYNEISHRKRHSIGHIDVSEEYSNLISTPKKRKNMKDYKNKGMKYMKKVNKSPISSYDNLTGVKELFTTPEKFGEVMTESTLESILNSPENSNASLVMPKSLLNKENQDGASSESSISVKILPNKRTARSRVAKKEDAVVEEQSIKRSTRGSNKSESEKSPSISRSRSNNDALGNVSPAPKLSTRGRKRLLESKDVEKEELTQKKINESVSEEVEEISTTKRSTRSKKVLTQDDGSDVQSSQSPKTRGRKPKSSNNDVDNTPIKKVTRSMRNNKKTTVLENDSKERNSSVESSSNMDVDNTPIKKVTRSRRNNKKTTVLENDSKERNSSVESSSNIDVDNTTAEKVTRSRGTNKKPTVSESDSKERNSSVASSSNIDVDNTAVEKVTRSRRNNKKSTVLESDSKESNPSVESSSYGNESKSDVLSPDERSNRGTRTTLSDSDKPPTDKSEKVGLTRKRSSRNKQNESNSTETAPITRVTRKTRVELSESENNESNILQKSPIEVGKPLRTRGRAHKLSETEVVVDTKKEPSPPPTKPRRTRRGKKVQEEEEEEPTNTNTPKTRAKSTNTANDESEPQQSSTKRRGRKKKDDDNLESSLTNKENVEINPKGRRKRNVQTKATETTESSPPKKGRKLKNTEENDKKTKESPIKRVTRSRAKRS